MSLCIATDILLKAEVCWQKAAIQIVYFVACLNGIVRMVLKIIQIDPDAKKTFFNDFSDGIGSVAKFNNNY